MMCVTDAFYGDQYYPPDYSRTFLSVLLRRHTWDEWREHRRYLAKRREERRWRAIYDRMAYEEHMLRAHKRWVER